MQQSAFLIFSLPEGVGFYYNKTKEAIITFKQNV